MSSFSCFDAETGELLSTDNRPDRDTVNLVGIVFDGTYQFGKHKMVDGQIVKTEQSTPVITPDDIDRHITRLLTYPKTSYAEWRINRHIERGEIIPKTMIEMREDIRIAGRALKAMSPIPEEFWDEKYWPKEIK